MAITAVVAIAAVVGAVSAHQQGAAANKQAKAQARIQEEQAAREVVVSGQDSRDFERKERALLARRRAESGASGTRSGTGSALLADEDFENEIELQAGRIREGGEIRSTRLQQQAGLTRQAGKSAQQAGNFRAGSSLLSGVGKAFA